VAILFTPAVLGVRSPGPAPAPGQGAIGIVIGGASRGGAEIATVLPASPAARAGLMSGDIITAIDGTPVSSFGSVNSALDDHAPGTRISMAIIRGERELKIRAVLGPPIEFTDPGYVGVTLRSEPTGGVLVVSVVRGGPAARAGLRAGDIITAVSGQPDGGSSVGAVLLIRRLHPGQVVRLAIRRDRSSRTINVIAGPQP